MSGKFANCIEGLTLFRIPMRGYEDAGRYAAGPEYPVPNPHEGL